MKNIPTQIETILTALFAGEATADEVTELREWLRASDDNRETFDEYRAWRFALTSYCARNRYDVDKAWARFTSLHSDFVRTEKPREKVQLVGQESALQVTNNTVRRRLLHLCRYAAIFIIAFGAGILTTYLSPTNGVATETAVTQIVNTEAEMFVSEYIVPYGSKSMIILPDSSQIWLNAGSKLRYNQAFNQVNREVYIEGEAYFNVTRDETKPFLVKTAAVTLKVLGTSFNVKAYPEEDNVETTVESGSVQVLQNSGNNTTDKLVLTAGQKMTVAKSAVDSMAETLSLMAAQKLLTTQEPGQPVVYRNVMTQLYTSWKDSCWLVEKEMLASLTVKLERRYNVRIMLTDEALKTISFSGTFKNESIEQVMEAIKLSAPVNYDIRRNNIKISMNKQRKES